MSKNISHLFCHCLKGIDNPSMDYTNKVNTFYIFYSFILLRNNDISCDIDFTSSFNFNHDHFVCRKILSNVTALRAFLSPMMQLSILVNFIFMPR